MAELWQSETAAAEQEEIPFETGYTAEVTASTVEADSEAVTSTYALLIDLDDNTIVAQRNARDRINPASMTKILTVLVAAEHITDLDDTFTITREITDYSYSNGCSSAGFDDGETVTVRDLFYGTILPSGADAAAGLAMYVSGSLEDFVGLMNEKIEELGLSADTHFTNCVGLYDENHYTTPYDMAMIMKAAMENELCQEVMSARKYTTSSTTEHPDGIELSNWFLRRIEDKDTNGEVLCAKTGYVVQSGNCASSYLVSDSGRHYICVTADAHSSWRCIYDHVAMYEKYAE
jgi:D-alanyl-D-alanine carboxypeptidase (penicillin-binding protein 5/6)